MNPLSAELPPVRRIRCWRVPPPLTRGSELLEGGDVLAEIQGEIGVIVWKSLRNVTLWAPAPAREQGALFARGAQERRLAEIESAAPEEALRRPLAAIAALLGAPGKTNREAVAVACRAVAQWADACGASATALAFIQAAALTCPNDARLAFAVGRLSRERAEHSRSETWFRRAVMLARQAADWETYALAYLGLGNLFVQRGNYPLARRAHVKGLRAARRRRLREIVAKAYHDLVAVEVATENGQKAQEFAAAAMRAYGAGHPRLPALAHDLAALWTLQGEFARALPVFQAVLPTLERPHERLLVLGNIARAAAGAGEMEVGDRAWESVWRATEQAQPGVGFAQALHNLAHAAVLRGDWDRAEDATRRASAIADARGEAQIRMETDALLDSIRSGRLREAHAATAPRPDLAAGSADALARQLIEWMRPAAAGA